MVTTKTFRLLILPLIILLTAAITSIQAQVIITGEVANEQGTPLPTANILLLDAADSTMVKGGITNEKGRFTIKNISRGTYLVSVSMVGFQKHHTDHFEVSGQPVDMGTIVMRKTVQQMDQVSVEARKPLFEQEIDRLRNERLARKFPVETDLLENFKLYDWLLKKAMDFAKQRVAQI